MYQKVLIYLVLTFCMLELCNSTDPKLVKELMTRLEAVYAKPYSNSTIKKYLDGIKKETHHAKHHELNPVKCVLRNIDIKWPTGKSVLEITKGLQDAAKAVEKALHDNLRCLEFLIYKIDFDDPHMPDPDVFKKNLL